MEKYKQKKKVEVKCQVNKVDDTKADVQNRCCAKEEDYVDKEKQTKEEQTIPELNERKNAVEPVAEESWKNYFIEEYKKSLEYLKQMKSEDAVGVGMEGDKINS